MRTHLRQLVHVAALFSVAAVGCAAQTDVDDEDEQDAESVSDELRDGINTGGCKRSPYNCHLNPGGSQRVRRADGKETWAIDRAWLAARGLVDPQTKAPVVPVVDGNGDEMGRTKKLSFTLNYGQTRRMNETTYVMAVSTGLGSAGWVPIDAFRASASLRERVGEVNGRGGKLKKLGCYQVRSGYDPKLDTYKVVRGAKVGEQKEPNDYLPMKRANGKVYMNLAFSVPGDGLGAPAIDIFPQGTRFQRVDVPTWEGSGRPSLEATLYARPAGSQAFTVPAGKMKFIYGYVKTPTGGERYGWMALDGLVASSGCR